MRNVDLSDSTASPPTSLPQTAAVHSRRVAVLDSQMAYLEQGEGRPILLLHGNPLSSHVWRRVLPGLRGRGRVLAPDLMGMGASGKPESAYRFQDHARYLEAFVEALGLEQLVLVGHDWGGVLALDWARQHARQVRGVAVFETMLEGLRFSDFPPQGAALFRALRTPQVGEALVLDRNEFLAISLENGVKTGLSAADRAAYYAPFPTAASRRPMLQWTRELPIDGEPAEMVAVVDQNATWMEQSARISKLLLTFEGAPLSRASRIANWTANPPPGLRVVPLGAAGHHATEDKPEEITAALVEWLSAIS